MKRSLFALTITITFPLIGHAQQESLGWPQYRGASGNGSTPEKISTPWTKDGPKPVWKNAVTKGFSSISVSGGVAASLVTRELEGVPTETCVAWDAATGKELWAFPLKMAKYDGGGDTDGPGDGPRSTPSFAKGKMFVLGSNLDLYALDPKSGKEIWKVDLMTSHKAKNIKWQSAASPMLEGNLCIVMAGGQGESLLAFDQVSGRLVWKGEDDAITHATPTVTTLLGVRQAVFFTQKGLVGVDVKDGKVLWRHDYPYKISTAASPIVWEDIVYCSAGYGVGGGAFKISKSGGTFAAAPLWRTDGKNSNHWSTPVCKDGYLYGMFSFKEFGKGPVACVDIRTGETKWSQPGFGPGNLIISHDRLLVLSDRGDLVLAEANPAAYKELARAKILEGKCWSTPTVAGGKIYARSTAQAACFEVPK